MLDSWQMPFGLPDLAWSTWLLIASGAFIFALFVPKFAPDGSRFAGRLAFVIIMLAAVCAAIGVWEWLKS
ncbi:MAG TPA: hypothetical protein VKS44_13080 [Candidatus Acidoferrales bacterium]|nr:hypothetical protein [Candidatus Acidoferrales bacterium]